MSSIQLKNTKQVKKQENTNHNKDSDQCQNKTEVRINVQGYLNSCYNNISHV